MLKIGIDVGGTFTDLVAVDDTGHSTLAKVAIDPGGPIDRRDGRPRSPRGRSWTCRPANSSRRPSASCMAPPSPPTRCSSTRAPRSDCSTTEGHRDVIEMREGLKDDRYNLRMPPPEQLVPRALRLGVTERMRADGTIETPLDHARWPRRSRR